MDENPFCSLGLFSVSRELVPNQYAAALGLHTLLLFFLFLFFITLSGEITPQLILISLTSSRKHH